MKTIKLFLILVLFSGTLFAQVREQGSVNSRKFIYNSAGLVNMGPELHSQISDSSLGVFSFSLKHTVIFEGMYYQSLYTNKQNSTNYKVVIRKSADGENWSPFVRVGDAAANEDEYYSNIYVWRKGANVHVGVMYGFWTTPNPHIRFALSTNGGASFQPSVQISSHTDNFTIFPGGLAGKGDTLMMNWVRQYATDRCDQTWFSRSTNGGVTWSPMAEAFAGNHYSFVADITMDNNGNAWSVTADDQFNRVNHVVRFTTNLGTSWETKTQINNMPSGHTNTNQQVRWFNNKLYAVWTHSTTYADSVMFSTSTNGGNDWSHKRVSDTDTLLPAGGTVIPIHPALTVADNGNIYVVWADSRERHHSILDSGKLNIYLSRSTNGGATWSSSIKVNDVSNYTRTYNAYPCVVVRSNGAVDSVVISWSKLRNILGPQAITQLGSEVPQMYALEQNYPNPFNPVTNIKVNISKSGFVSLKVFDITGREAAILVDEEMNAGIYNIDFNASSLPSGVYFYRMTVDGFTDTKKMILVK